MLPHMKMACNPAARGRQVPGKRGVFDEVFSLTCGRREREPMLDASSLAIGLAVTCPPQWLPVLLSFAILPSGTSPWDRCGATCTNEVWAADADTFTCVPLTLEPLSPVAHAHVNTHTHAPR